MTIYTCMMYLRVSKRQKEWERLQFMIGVIGLDMWSFEYAYAIFMRLYMNMKDKFDALICYSHSLSHQIARKECVREREIMARGSQCHAWNQTPHHPKGPITQKIRKTKIFSSKWTKKNIVVHSYKCVMNVLLPNMVHC